MVDAAAAGHLNPSRVPHTEGSPSPVDALAQAIAPSQTPDRQPTYAGSLKPSDDAEADATPADSVSLNAGYESSDDMDAMFMRRCVNCTAELWDWSICRDCGHSPEGDAQLFDARGPISAGNSVIQVGPRMPTDGSGQPVLAYDERMTLHEEGGGTGHPERPDRVRAIMARLEAAAVAGRCRRLPAREANDVELEACHTTELISQIEQAAELSKQAGGRTLHLKPDTYVNSHTALCARLSAGACVDVAVAVATGQAPSGAAICRPPGHHAESNTAMGFCFYNNAAVATRAAQAVGAERVLIFDWDVHHGNGTQHIFEDDPSVLYISIHRHDGGQFYPGTGSVYAVGGPSALGYCVNVGWPCGGMGNADYLAAMHHVILPVATEFNPDLIILSAGYDAAKGDPIGGCNVTPEAYAHMAAALQAISPTVAILEGGYNLSATAAATEATLRVLLGERPPPVPLGEGPTSAGMAAVAQAARVQSRYWSTLRGVAHMFGSIPGPEVKPMLRPYSAAELPIVTGDEAGASSWWNEEAEEYDEVEDDMDDYETTGEEEEDDGGLEGRAAGHLSTLPGSAQGASLLQAHPGVHIEAVDNSLIRRADSGTEDVEEPSRGDSGGLPVEVSDQLPRLPEWLSPCVVRLPVEGFGIHEDNRNMRGL